MEGSFSQDGVEGPPLDWQALDVETSGTSGGHCDCCGTETRRVWGFVSDAGEVLAAYYVGWTLDRPDHSARFELILGRWGDEAGAGDRAWVVLEHRVVEGEGAFRVVDAPLPDDGKAELAAAALKRDEVIGTPLAAQVFAIADAIFMKDARLEEVRGRG